MQNSSFEHKLNKEQIEAIQHGSGPLLIIAGAGTGKTTVVTERIKWFISQNLAKPSEILALTFTDKAAREMEERVDIALPYGYTQMWITTFHAFGERILRQEAVHIGLDPGFRLMTDAESTVFFRRNLFKFDLNYFRPLGNPRKFIEGMLSHFARLKDEDVSPSEYIRWAQSQKSQPKADQPLAEKVKSPRTIRRLADFRGKQKSDEEENIDAEKTMELAHAYQKYEELKIKEGLMDFGDLISNTLRIFRERRNVLKQYQSQFKYLLIDEFQDTNFAQNELAILLAGERRNITVVGDDDQAIYRFRGAAISNIIQFRKNFPQTKIVILTKNYRSTSEILNRAYTLIQFNNPDRLEVKEKINKKLLSERKISGEKVEFIYTERVEDEAEEVVKKIKNQKSKIKDEKGEELYSWKDFAILVRANNHAEPFVRALQRAGIPYQFLGPGLLFRQAEVKDLIAYIKLLHDFSDSVAVFRVLSMPLFDISSRDLVAINSFSRRAGLTLFESIETIIAFTTKDINHWSMKKNYQSLMPYISERTYIALSQWLTMVNKHLKLTRTETAGQILYYFLEDTGILKQLTEYKTAKEEKTALNISKFFDKLKSYEINHEEANVSAVVDWIEMSMELGESPLAADTDWTENDAVNILTVHSSKGLEFGVVFLVNLVNQRFPTNTRREQIPIPETLVKEILPEGDYHLEEERRLFYVGMTRARDRLILSSANYYGEAKRERKISPFVIETLGEKNLPLKQLHPQAHSKQLTLLEWKKADEPSAEIIRQRIEYLSYSQIETYMTCPLQYKYRYITKIPVPTNAAGSFGTSIHATLQKFYQMVKNDEKPGKDSLLNLLDKVWLPVGYGNKQYEESMKSRGKDMLNMFYEKFYEPDVIPKNLEQMFVIRLMPNLKIGGKIDRVDITKEGKLEIIDYKTGKRPSDKEISENLQMTVYALAANDPGIYNKKPEEVILTFYFFDTQEKVSSVRRRKQLEEAKIKLIEKAKEISQSTFEPKTGPWCDFCDFRMICEAWQ